MYWPKQVSTESKRKTIRKPFRSKVGDEVIITDIRNIFTRVYDAKWTGEIFRHTQRIMRGGLQIYRMKDSHDEEIKRHVLSVGIAESRCTGRWHMENREHSDDEKKRKQ
jgi:hypothetical protein